LLVVGVSIGLHPLLGVAAGGAGAASLWRRTRGFKRREEFRHRRELADVAVLLGVGLASGLPIVAAIDATAELGRSETARRLSVVGRSIVAGETLSGALDRWTLAVGGRASDLAAILGDIERGGTGARARLEHLVDSLARDEQLALAEHARKTPVLMLVPLVTCVLPAFAAVTVIPVILAALGRLHVG
jgi:pilus assembly protein TadC